MKLSWIISGLALSTALPGCIVSQAKYDRLKAEFEDYQDEAEAREESHQATIKSLEDALREEQARINDLDKQIAQLKAEKMALASDKSRMAKTEAELIAALRELEERKALAERRVAEYRNLLSRFKSLIDAGKLRVRIIDGQMVVELATDVLFTSGSAALSPEGKQAIMEVARVLREIPDRRYQIAGHTDDIPIRTSRYPSNWYLAFDRAHSVTQAMFEAGMGANQLSAASYGEFRPSVPNTDDASRARNRRIEIIVVPDLSQLPGAEELEQLNTTTNKT